MTDSTVTKPIITLGIVRIQLQEERQLPGFGGLPRRGLLKLADPPCLSDCEMVRFSATSLTKFRTLSSSKTTLLFTPAVIPQDPTLLPSINSKDPFEFLGRAFSQQHPRIRHVPYLPGVGFTRTHGVFLRHCDMVIVVACQPSDEAEAGLSRQADFVDGVADFLDGGKSVAPLMPKSLVHFGVDNSQIDLPAYENVLQTDTYNHQTAHRMVQLLFNSSH